MPNSQRLPHTEGIVPIRQNTEQLRMLDKHPALIQAEHVLRLLYEAIATYDKRYPGALPESVKNAVLVLREALINHSLVEQSIRLQVAVSEIHAHPAVKTCVQVHLALGEVEKFLALPLPSGHH